MVLSERSAVADDPRWSVTAVSTVSEVPTRTDDHSPDCIVCDHDPPAIESITAVARLRNESPTVPIVVATDQGSERLASDVTLAGATSYVPCSPAEWSSLRNHLEEAVGSGSPGTTPDPNTSGDVLGLPFEGLPVGIVALDQRGTVIDANEPAMDLLGVSQETILNSSIGAIADDQSTDQDLEAEYRAILDELVTTDASVDSLQWTTTVGETRRHVDLTLALLSKNGHDGTVGVLRDISEKKRQREELDRFETLVEAIPDPIYELDEAGRLTYWNQAALEQFGYDDVDPDEFDVTYFDIIPAEEIEKIQNKTRELLSGETTESRTTIAHQAVRSNGQQFPVQNHFALRFTENGQLGGAAGTIRDISHQKRRKQRLHVLNRVLRHNLGNDMNTIMGYAELLTERIDDPELKGFADSIIRTAVGLASMAENVRRLQDVVEEGVAPDQTTDIGSQLEVACDWIRESYPLADVSVDYPESSVVVHGTPKLRVAFQEVLENAVEHANRPQPAVSVKTEVKTKQIEITIEDEGPGIPEHERAVLTGTEEITPLTHGSGLGLWTVKWIVEAAQGTVDIETGEQRGSTVTITLQRAQTES